MHNASINLFPGSMLTSQPSTGYNNAPGLLSSASTYAYDPMLSSVHSMAPVQEDFEEGDAPQMQPQKHRSPFKMPRALDVGSPYQGGTPGSPPDSQRGRGLFVIPQSPQGGCKCTEM